MFSPVNLSLRKRTFCKVRYESCGSLNRYISQRFGRSLQGLTLSVQRTVPCKNFCTHEQVLRREKQWIWVDLGGLLEKVDGGGASRGATDLR